MTGLLVALLAAASLTFGLRATALVMEEPAHPMDRLVLAAYAGVLITAVILQVSASYRMFELGLGLVLSLSPVGPFDFTKWWFRSRGRRSRWLIGSEGSALVVASALPCRRRPGRRERIGVPGDRRRADAVNARALEAEVALKVTVAWRVDLHRPGYEEQPLSRSRIAIIPGKLALSPGTRLGVYEVTAQIGEGGMGQVSRVRGTNLNRDVIKVLPRRSRTIPIAWRLSSAKRSPRVPEPPLPRGDLRPGLSQRRVFSPADETLVMELVESDDLSGGI